MAKISLIVNGNPVTANIDPRTLLVQFLRENLKLTGTHVGCDTSQCGACVVHLDGKAVKACTTLAVMADGRLTQNPPFPEYGFMALAVALVAGLYPRLGFSPEPEAENGRTRWSLALRGARTAFQLHIARASVEASP